MKQRNAQPMSVFCKRCEKKFKRALRTTKLCDDCYQKSQKGCKANDFR